MAIAIITTLKYDLMHIWIKILSILDNLVWSDNVSAKSS